MKDEEAAVLKKILKEHEVKKQKREQNKPITINDLQKIFKEKQKGSLTCSSCGKIHETDDIYCPECGSKTNIENVYQIQAQPMQQKQLSMQEKKRIAYDIWRDSRSTTIVCLIAMLAPLLCVLIGVVYAAAALLTAMGIMIYPIFIFVKHQSLQAKLFKKYGFKPLLFPKPPMQQIPGSRSQKQDQEIF